MRPQFGVFAFCAASVRIRHSLTGILKIALSRQCVVLEKVIIYGDKVEVQFKIHVPDDDDTISPLSSEKRIKVLQNGYRNAV